MTSISVTSAANGPLFTHDEEESAPLDARVSGPQTRALSPEVLVEYLRTRGFIDDQSHLNKILGTDRHHLTTPKLEKGLLRKFVMTPEELLEIKSEISGRAPMPKNASGTSRLPKAIAYGAGAIVLTEASVGSPRLTVAMVEDKAVNVQAVVSALGTDDFDIVLCLSPQFEIMVREAYASGVKLDEAPAPLDIYQLLDDASLLGVSDIHLAVGQPPMFRIDGTMRKLDGSPRRRGSEEHLPRYAALSQGWMNQQCRDIGGGARMDTEFKERFALDPSLEYGVQRYRVNIGMNGQGLTLVLRALASTIPSMDDLRLPWAIRDFTKLERGLVLITGPTGSGKSTTLAALLADIALKEGRKIITLEDPQEFSLPRNGPGFVSQREKGSSFRSFAEGLHQALREDPDIILVGEMRDAETMEVAINAAETGHLVFSTLHTKDAPGTVRRILGEFPDRTAQMCASLAGVLEGVVCQTLVPKIGGGRCAAHEILVATPAIRNNLKKVDGASQLKQSIETGAKYGMQSVDKALADLVAQGLVSEEDAVFKSHVEDDFRRYLSSAIRL